MATVEIFSNQHLDEAIELDLDQLPELADVKMILLDENVRLRDWIRVSTALYKCNRVNDFICLLECCTYEANLDYPEAKRDELLALDTLAAYHLMAAQQERRFEARREHLSKANTLLTMADNIHMYEEYHLLGRAFFCHLEGTNDKLEQADAQFKFLLEKNLCNVPAILGRASICYKRGDYKSALEYYRTAIRTAPHCPAEVRLAMAQCFFKLGDIEKTRLALERALALKPDCMDALVGLAVLDLNRGTKEDIRIGVQRLTSAYQRDGDNPVVLVGLADHFFFKRDPENCKILALHAFHVTENDNLRAQACYQLARALHDQNDFNQAYQFYYQATLFDKPNYLLPYFGLGQIYIMRNEIDKAINCMEKVVAGEPNFVTAIRILGSLYAMSNKPDSRKLAMEYLRKAIALVPTDAEAMIELAKVLQERESEASLEMYKRALAVLDDCKDKDLLESPELLNNMGALHFRGKRYVEAMKNFERAIRAAKDKLFSNEPYYRSLLITISYNLGRVNEALRNVEVAEQIYRDILLKNPSYVDCYLRLGCMARDKGQIYDASVWFKEALQYNQGHTESWELIGNLHLSKREWGPAQKKFERILRQQESANNVYSLVALGNIWLLSMQQIPEDREKGRCYLERAFKMFRKALTLSPSNVYACNGIGCVLAHLYCLKDSRRIFTNVREAVVNFPDAWLNIAHIYVEEDQPSAAILLYENAMKKFGYENNVEVELYLARAYFRANKMKQCKKIIIKTRVLAPFEPLLLYNLALTLMMIAMEKLKDSNSHLNDVLCAVKYLKEAEIYFSFLAVNHTVPTYSGHRSMALARKCKALFNKAQVQSERAQQISEEMRRLRQEKIEKRRLEFEEQQQLQREKEAAEQRLKAEQEQRRLFYLEKTKQLLSAPEPVMEKPKSTRKSKAKAIRAENDGFFNDDSDLGYTPSKQTKRSKKRKASHSRRSALVDTSGDEDVPKVIRVRKQRKADLHDISKKIKSRELLSSATSSSDEAEQKQQMSSQEPLSEPAAASVVEVEKLHNMLFSGDEDDDIDSDNTDASDSALSADDTKAVLPVLSSSEED